MIPTMDQHYALNSYALYKSQGLRYFYLNSEAVICQVLLEKTVFYNTTVFENYSIPSLTFAMNSSGVNTVTQDFA